MAQYSTIQRIGARLELDLYYQGRLKARERWARHSSKQQQSHHESIWRLPHVAQKKCDVAKWKARVSQPVVALSNEWRENCRRSIQSGTPCRCQRAKNEAVLQLFVSSNDIREVHQLNLKLDNYVVNHMGYKSSSLGVRWVLILNLKNFSALSLES